MADTRLDLHVEIEDFSGRTWRWSAEERAAWDIPSSLSCSSRRGDGFAEASVTLRRPITQDFPDLGLLHTMRFVGPDGSIAWEGRVTAFPRSSAPDGETFQVTGAGYMSHATDRTFQEIYVDRDLGRFADSSFAQQAYMMSASVFYDGTATIGNEESGTTGPAIVFRWSRLNTVAASRHTVAEMWYYGGGVDLGEVRYAFDNMGTGGADASWIDQVSLRSGDTQTFSGDAGVDHDATDATSATLTATTTGRTYVQVQSRYTGTYTGDVGDAHTFRQIRIFGRHGLTKQIGSENEGFYASDIVENIVERFCPMLTIGEVDPTSYPIEQLAFHEPISPYAALQQINGFHLYDLAVWEDKKFYWTQPKPLDDWDWEVRLDDPNTQANLQGDSIEDVANGIVVRYTDLRTGAQEFLTPETNAELADTSESNPANLAGIDRWTEISLSYSTLETDATQIGRAALGEFSRPKAPGEIQTGPTITDRSGNKQPGWKVRAGDRLVIADHPNDSPRRINEVRWDDGTVKITTDLYSHRLEALFSRITQGRSARGL